MNLKNILFAAVLAVAGGAAVAGPASAFSFGGLVKGIAKTVTNTVKKAEHTVSREAKAVAHTASKAVSSVGRTVGVVAKDVGRAVSKAPTVYMAVAKPVGKAVSAYYRFGAAVLEKTPLKGFAPLARDAARAAASRSGKVGAAVGAGLAMATGGLSYIGTAAGSGAMVGYYGHKGAGMAKREYRKAAATIRAAGRDTAREIRTSAREIRSSIR